MATTANSRQRKARRETAEPQVTTFAFPTMAEEHLDIPMLEQWLWSAGSFKHSRRWSPCRGRQR